MADAGVPIIDEDALAEPEEWEAAKNSKRVNDPILSHHFLQSCCTSTIYIKLKCSTIFCGELVLKNLVCHRSDFPKELFTIAFPIGKKSSLGFLIN